MAVYNAQKITDFDGLPQNSDGTWLLPVSDPSNGKPYKTTLDEIKYGKQTLIAAGTDFDTLTTPGTYRIDKDLFMNGSYLNTPFPVKHGIFMPDDALLIVETYGDNRVLQRILWPTGRNTEISRIQGKPVYARSIVTGSTSFLLWEITSGEVELIYYYDSTISAIHPDSINTLNDYETAGNYIIQIWNRNTSNTTLGYNMSEAQLLAIDAPNIREYDSTLPTNSVITGTMFLKIEYYPLTSLQEQLRQRFFYTPWNYNVYINKNSLPFEFVRDCYTTGPGSIYGAWKPYGNMTLTSMMKAAGNKEDRILPAGTTTTPSLIFEAGSPYQNPRVPGALNYNGYNLALTDSSNTIRTIPVVKYTQKSGDALDTGGSNVHWVASFKNIGNSVVVYFNFYMGGPVIHDVEFTLCPYNILFDSTNTPISSNINEMQFLCNLNYKLRIDKAGNKVYITFKGDSVAYQYNSTFFTYITSIN